MLIIVGVYSIKGNGRYMEGRVEGRAKQTLGIKKSLSIRIVLTWPS